MPKVNKYGLELHWAPEFPWMFEDTEEKLGDPCSSEVGMVCPTTEQKLGTSEIFSKNHYMADCRRLTTRDCAAPLALFSDMVITTGPDDMVSVIEEAFKSQKAVFVVPPRRMSLEECYKVGCAPRGWSMGMFSRKPECYTGVCGKGHKHVTNELFVIDPEGVCFGAGIFLGWVVTVDVIPKRALYKLEPWVLYLRKRGYKGAHVASHVDWFLHGSEVYDPYYYGAMDIVQDDPKGKFSSKAYAMLRGYRGLKPILYVDQYGCDYTGSLAEGLTDYADFSLAEMKELFPVWSQSLDYEVVVAWHTVRDARFVMKLQTCATIRSIEYVGEPMDDIQGSEILVKEPVHVLSADAIVSKLPKLIDLMQQTDAVSVVESIYKAKLAECGFVMQFGYVECCQDDCTFRGWLAGNMIDGFACTSCDHVYDVAALQAQSSGVLPDKPVLYTQSTALSSADGFKLYGMTVVPFGGCLYWTPGAGVWFPIIKSAVKAYDNMTFTGVVGCKAIVKETGAVCKALYLDYVAFKCSDLKQRELLGVHDVWHKQLLLNRGDYSLLLENVDYFMMRRAKFSLETGTVCAEGFMPFLLDNVAARAYYLNKLIRVGHKFGDLSAKFGHKVVSLSRRILVLSIDSVQAAASYITLHLKDFLSALVVYGGDFSKKLLSYVKAFTTKTAIAVAWLVFHVVHGAYIVVESSIYFVVSTPDYARTVVESFQKLFRMTLDCVRESLLKGLSAYRIGVDKFCFVGNQTYRVCKGMLQGLVMPSLWTHGSKAVFLEGPAEPVRVKDSVVDVLKEPLTSCGFRKTPSVAEKICIVDNVYMAKCGDYYHPIVVDGDYFGLLDQAWRFPCAGKSVTFDNQDSVKEFVAKKAVTVHYELDSDFNKILDTACATFEVDQNVDMEEFTTVVIAAIEEKLSPCRDMEQIGSKVCAFLQKLEDNDIYLFDEEGDCKLSSKLYCTFSAPIDEDFVCSEEDEDASSECDVEEETSVDEAQAIITAPLSLSIQDEQSVCVASGENETDEPLLSEQPDQIVQELVIVAQNSDGPVEADSIELADNVDLVSMTVEQDVVVPQESVYVEVGGLFAPKADRTNCWLRSVLLVMQKLPCVFKDAAMQAMWIAYCKSYSQDFVDALLKNMPANIRVPQGGYVADFAYWFLTQCEWKTCAFWRCLKCDTGRSLSGLDAMFFYGDCIAHRCKCGSYMVALAMHVPFTVHCAMKDKLFCTFVSQRRNYRAACVVDVNNRHSMAVVDICGLKQIDDRLITAVDSDKFDFMIGDSHSFGMTPFEIAQLYGSCITPNVCFIKGDVIKVTQLLGAEYLVNPANGHMRHGGGVAKAIAQAAGAEFVNETANMVKDKGVCQVGQCYVSTGGKLCKKVLNVVGPDARSTGKQSYALLERAYAHLNGYDECVTTLISAGIFSVPSDVSLTYLLGSVDKRVVLVSNRQEDVDIITKCTLTSVDGTKKLAERLSKNVGRPILYDTNVESLVFKSDPFVSTFEVLQTVQSLRHDIKIDDDARAYIQAVYDAPPMGWRVVNKYIQVGGVRTINYVECPGNTLLCSQGNDFGYVQNGSFKKATVAQVKSLFLDRIEILVTVDGVNFSTKYVVPGVTFGKQIGSAFCDFVNVTRCKVDSSYAGKVCFVYDQLTAADKQAVRQAFNFDEKQLLTYYNFLSCCKWEICFKGKFFALKQADNNCYVNVACLMLQHLNLKFGTTQWQEAWLEFRAGKPLRFIALVFAAGGFKFGEPSDARDFIRFALTQADLASAKCDYEFVCQCGVKQEQRIGVDAVMHFGTLDKSDLENAYTIQCSCGNKAIHCTAIDVPFLICSNTPGCVDKSIPAGAKAVNVFAGGHYTHIKCDSKLQLFDAINVKDVQAVSGDITDCLYVLPRGIRQTFKSVLTTYYLDDVKHIEYKPDLSQYYCEGGRYYTQRIVKAQFKTFEKVDGVYTNFRLVGNAICASLNKKLGFDASKDFEEYKVTEWPVATGDVVLASDDLYVKRYEKGCITFGKPVIWRGHEKASLASLTYFNKPSLVIENRYDCLKVDDPVVEDGVISPVQNTTEVIKLNGVKKPFKVEDKLVINDASSTTKYVNSLTIVDVIDMWLTGCRYVVKIANALSVVVNVPTIKKFVKFGIGVITIPFKLLGLREQKTKFLDDVKRVVRRPFNFLKWFFCPFIQLLPFVSVNSNVIYTTEVASKLTCKLLASAIKHALMSFKWRVAIRGCFMIATVFLLWFNFIYANVIFSDFYLPRIGFLPTFYGKIAQWVKQTFGLYTFCDAYNITIQDIGVKYQHCNDSLACKLCFSGFDMLDNYNAIDIIQYEADRTSFFDYTSIIKIGVELIVSYALYTMWFYPLFCLICLQILTTWLPEFFMLNSLHWFFRLLVYLANLFPAHVFLRFYIVVTAIYKIVCLFRHIVHGCCKPGCLFCYKRNRSVRVKCSTIVGGMLRYYDVMANGGTGFCNKHQWNCIGCDSYKPGNTFITVEAAAELSKEFRRPVHATDVAYHTVTDVKQVGCNMRLFYERDGQRLYDDVNASLFVDYNNLLHSRVKSVPNMHVVVVENEADKANFLSAAVFYAQSLFRPILMVDKNLVTTANTGTSVSKTMFDVYVDTFLSMFDVDRKSLNNFIAAAHKSILEGVQLEDVLAKFISCVRSDSCSIDSDVDTNVVAKSVISAVSAGIEITDDSYNNLVPTYIKTDTISAADLGVLIQHNCKHVQGNVAKMASVACVWSFDAYNQLSSDFQHKLKKACCKTGLKLKVTYNKQFANVSILTTPFSLKGGNVVNFLYWIFKQSLCFLWKSTCFVYRHSSKAIYVAFVVNVILFVVLWGLMPTYTIHKTNFELPVYASFKVIDNGVVRDVSVHDVCFANKFEQFDVWYEATFGLTYYRNSMSCPIVVAVTDQDIGYNVYNVPTKVYRYGYHVLHFITHAFSNDGIQCYTPHYQISYNNFYDSGCVLSSACTMFATVDGVNQPYCYTEGLIANASLYSSLVPHVRYNLANSKGYIRFPDVLREGLVRVVRTKSMMYCRIGLCEASDEGICFNFNGSWVLNNEYYRNLPGTFCGKDVFELFTQFMSGLTQPVDFFALTASSIAGAILAIIVVLVFYYLIKLKRAFGDYTSIVVVNVIVWFVNFLMLFVFQVYPTLAIFYAAFYFYITLYFPSEISVVMHMQWLVMYGTIMPLWFCLLYIAIVISNHAFWVFSYCRKVGTGMRSDGTFEETSLTTFMITKDSYCRLRNSLSDVAFNKYLSLYNKYRYYSGKMDTAAYREAACAHLAKAMDTFTQNNGSDVLYQPPTASVSTSFLQSGIVKMVNPTSKVEPCMVSVTYGSMTLNGLWLDDKVYCPRHVICSQSDLTNPDYTQLLCRVTSSDFTVMFDRMSLTVMSYQMQGCMLVLTVTLQNPKTPKYTFGVVKPGETFTVLATYNGKPQGAFHVTMRSSFTIKGSFLCGSCGSVGYVMMGDCVKFVYMHQLELSTGCHTGTDFNGDFYGPYKDAQVVQLPIQDYVQTVNFVAWLYAAILNNCNWFVQSDTCCIEDFNMWAMSNGFSQFVPDLVIDALASMTGVTVEKLLAAIKRLHNGFHGRQIMGSCSFEDELTPTDVYQQLAGVKLQSKRTRFIKGTVCWILTSTVLMSCIISAFVKWTMFMYVTTHMLSITISALCCISFAMLFVKHKHFYLTMYIIPVFLTLLYNNYLFVYKQSVRGYVYAWLTHLIPSVDYTYTDEVIYASLVLILMVFTTWRSINHDCFSVVILISRIVSLFTMWYLGSSLDKELLILITSMFGTYTWTTTLSLIFAEGLGSWLTKDVLFFTDIPKIKLTLISYLLIGYFLSCYWGVLSLCNSIFKIPLGVYNYKISVQELRYMNANGLRPPRNSFEAMILNFKLMGIGGVPMIEVSQIQSKLTDVKCANVVLLNCLQHLHVASNSKLWQYCSTLHNEILATSDLNVAFEKLAQLLIVLFANPAAADSKVLASIEDVCDDYARDNTVLQALQSEFVNMASFVEYEVAKKNLDEAKASGTANQQQIKQLEKACNIAKSAYERDRAVARKLERMADLALTNMYKEARINDKKSKVVSALQTMLFSMVRKLDNQALNSILDNAVKGCVPLNAIPSLTANTLTIIVPDKQVYDQVVDNVYVAYAGNVWHIQNIQDADGANKQLNEINEQVTWPLVITANRHNEVASAVMQNNELMPARLRTQVVNSGPDMNCNTPTQCYYNNTNTGRVIYAILSDVDGLKYTKIVKEDQTVVVLELDPPCKFTVQDVKGVKVKYLYFVKGCNTLARGWVVGTISSTVRLQAGTPTEYASNSSVLSLCAFSVDPKKTYLDFVQQGGVPLTNCVKMLCDHAGTGMAITVKPEATTNQDSYGGASVCIYCRARVEHPDVDGLCKLRGKFVQVPVGIKDPVSYILTHDVCQVCGFWRDGSCSCVNTGSTVQSKDSNFLNGFGVRV
ncbi:ORF1a polyprotein [Rodent coronavirus]|uniref:ORF1a polyprotein n=1 Tax=Rodent coronavirus TaxID=2050018 RepID=UPI001891B1CB|nr:ORF1a polyprotein [Rodent coronavirus]